MSIPFMPKEVSDARAAFPAYVIRDGYLPARESIPEEFSYSLMHRREWNKLFNDLFFGTEKSKTQGLILYHKDGIDPEKAFRHIKACMGSYEPKHEHKEEGCAYLFSIWFERYQWIEHDLAKGKIAFMHKDDTLDFG